MMNLKGTTHAITAKEAEEFNALRQFFANATGVIARDLSHDEIMGQGYADGGDGVHLAPNGFKWLALPPEEEWVTPCGYKLEDFLSPNLSKLPYGYDTVLGYLAKKQPEVLMGMDEVAESTQRDGFWLMHRARRLGTKAAKVVAPRFLQDQGITEVNAYPVTLLEERFGA